ncbi:uncharacterized protein BBA_05111 [Beauveria bassiana ARSEF 2860]|uniref:Uncharacterized protein n=1 Tax=Beauveria bassiana (strain ARSEF 2860) TaxID=655819 RepID=J4W789_BEAB2|nr:uncharacterized protein BBA_05111 [Beauveria bassiana ARSEF 2860]EJP66140.1 hypothetical protein BBA_05111 [Beauveria bassiana ARSEF 2860]
MTQARSPDIRPCCDLVRELEGHFSTILEVNTTLLSLESPQQSVQPYVKFGKDMQRPVRFRTSSDEKEFKTRWKSWEFVSQSEAFRLQPTDGRYMGCKSWATGLPVGLVMPLYNPSDSRSIEFTTADSTVFKTKRKHWRTGCNGTFFVVLHEAQFYMAFSLPEGESEGGLDNRDIPSPVGSRRHCFAVQNLDEYRLSLDELRAGQNESINELPEDVKSLYLPLILGLLEMHPGKRLAVQEIGQGPYSEVMNVD